MKNRHESQIEVHVTNLKKLLPACRRCRIRSDQMLRDEYQPMICKKCRDVMKEEYPHMVSLDKADFEKSRECLFNHERECNCWEEGLRFPDEHK